MTRPSAVVVVVVDWASGRRCWEATKRKCTQSRLITSCHEERLQILPRRWHRCHCWLTTLHCLPTHIPAGELLQTNQTNSETASFVFDICDHCPLHTKTTSNNHTTKTTSVTYCRCAHLDMGAIQYDTHIFFCFLFWLTLTLAYLPTNFIVVIEAMRYISAGKLIDGSLLSTCSPASKYTCFYNWLLNDSVYNCGFF